MKTIAQLARIKKIRAKKRKLLKEFGEKPDMFHPEIQVSELYAHTPTMARVNYGTIFKRKAHRSPYFKSVNKSFGPKKKV